MSRGQGLQQMCTPALIPQEMKPSFSKDLNNEQLALWLQIHPTLTGTDYREDINKLKGTLMQYIIWHINFGLFYDLSRSKSECPCIS